MSELIERLREEFQDEDARHIYAEDLLNTYIATQIKVLREKAGWTQAELAERAGMKQERISVLEDVNYSSWTANVLKRIAKAFDLRLSIKIESFGSYLEDLENFNRESLKRPSFKDDPAFQVKETGTAVAAGAGKTALSHTSPIAGWREVETLADVTTQARIEGRGEVIDMENFRATRKAVASEKIQRGDGEGSLAVVFGPKVATR